MISRSIPVRFDTETIEDLDQASDVIGLTRSGLVKMAVALQLEAVREGVVPLSVDRVLALRRKRVTVTERRR